MDQALQFDAWFQRLGMCQVAPAPASGHRWLAAAALFGLAYAVGHLITVVVTCAEEGFGWGATAWSMDMSGYLAGVCFVGLCKAASNKPGSNPTLKWILFWAGITACVKVLDTLMLFGIVQLSAVYVTPDGAVLATNIVSEVIIGTCYVLAALIGSVKLKYFPEDDSKGFLDTGAEYSAIA